MESEAWGRRSVSRWPSCALFDPAHHRLTICRSCMLVQETEKGGRLFRAPRRGPGDDAAPFPIPLRTSGSLGKQASKQGNEQRVANIRIVPSLIKDTEKNALVFSEIVLICSDSRQSRVIEAVRHFGECSRAGLAVQSSQRFISRNYADEFG